MPEPQRDRGTALRWMRSALSVPPTFRQRTLCLLLPEKGDRSAVDEECEPSITDLLSTIQPPLFFAFSCRRRGTAERWMRSNALPYSKTSPEGQNASFVSRWLPPSPTGEGIFARPLSHQPPLFAPTPAPHPPKKVVISINPCYNGTTDLLRAADRNSLSHDTVAEVEKQKIRRRKS